MVWMARHRNWFQYFVSFVWFFSDHKANYARLVLIPSRDWLEARKAANNIGDIEAALKEGSTRSTSIPIDRTPPDMGQCDIAKDGMSRKSRRVALAPMDYKLPNALYSKIKQHSRGRDRMEADIATKVDEYLSSRVCCYCTKQGREQQVDFLQLLVQDTARLDDDLEKVFRTIWRPLHNTCYGSSNARAGLSDHRDVKDHPKKWILPVEPFQSPQRTSAGQKRGTRKRPESSRVPAPRRSERYSVGVILSYDMFLMLTIRNYARGLHALGEELASQVRQMHLQDAILLFGNTVLPTLKIIVLIKRGNAGVDQILYQEYRRYDLLKLLSIQGDWSDAYDLEEPLLPSLDIPERSIPRKRKTK
ncbi:hypothetical protein VTP01DRAFT_10688 [Rhizomucor pusillus]|uniref:uncharacterized protein n=1 Tax=Rhizomucor pusillus TaxID=4840 RepID=UPI003741E8E4